MGRALGLGFSAVLPQGIARTGLASEVRSCIKVYWAFRVGLRTLRLMLQPVALNGLQTASGSVFK